MPVDMAKMREASRENRRKMVEELHKYYLAPKDVFDCKDQRTLNRAYEKMLREKLSKSAL